MISHSHSLGYRHERYYDLADGPGWLPRLVVFGFPVSASCSKKLDQSSASVSLLDAPLSINSVAKLGVLGVRNGVPGTRSLPGILEVPGRASPACSRCSSVFVSGELGN